MNKRLTELESFFRVQVDFQGKVVLGGSHAIDEASEGSDFDYYIVCKSWLELFRILKNKEKIKRFRLGSKEKVQYIFCTDWMLRNKFVYLYGSDKEKNEYQSKNDLRFLQNNFLKIAYQEYISATMGKKHKAHHLGKALLSAVYVIGIENHIIDLSRMPLWSAKKAIQALPSLLDVCDRDLCEKILNYKLVGSVNHISNHEVEYVRGVLKKAHEYFAKHSFSWRSYLIYNIFSFRNKSFKYLFKNPDKYVVKKLQGLLSDPHEDKFMEIRKEVCKLLIL